MDLFNIQYLETSIFLRLMGKKTMQVNAILLRKDMIIEKNYQGWI